MKWITRAHVHVDCVVCPWLIKRFIDAEAEFVFVAKDPALLKLADVVNAADTGTMDKNPFATGLEAIAQGYSLLYPDDHKNIEQQFQVYDALYNYFRLQAPK